MPATYISNLEGSTEKNGSYIKLNDEIDIKITYSGEHYTIEDNNVINLTYCMDPDHLITIDPFLHNMSSLIEINEKEFVVSIVEVSIDSWLKYCHLGQSIRINI